jgi:hypothetical protein
MKYNRTIKELEEHACKWWPDYLIEIQDKVSVLPKLLATQDKFISILILAKQSDPDILFNVMNSVKFSYNLFLKHLMVLTDFGSEPLQRINRDFSAYFPSKKFIYLTNGKEITYNFKGLPVKGSLTNTKMKTDVKGLQDEMCDAPLFRDIIMLLLYGANAKNDSLATIFSKCMVGNLLGNKEELKNYIKQRYIFVSRIIGGSLANNLGNAAQVYAESYFKKKLGNSYSIQSNGHIPNISQNNRTPTTFDLVVGHKGKYVGIEISFQVTTNSTIERKSGQAKDRYQMVNASGNYIAYIIDGAGNFQRSSALETICSYSHCTVAYSQKEFDVLINFIKEKIG